LLKIRLIDDTSGTLALTRKILSLIIITFLTVGCTADSLPIQEKSQIIKDDSNLDIDYYVDSNDILRSFITINDSIKQ